VTGTLLQRFHVQYLRWQGFSTASTTLFCCRCSKRSCNSRLARFHREQSGQTGPAGPGTTCSMTRMLWGVGRSDSITSNVTRPSSCVTIHFLKVGLAQRAQDGRHLFLAVRAVPPPECPTKPTISRPKADGHLHLSDDDCHTKDLHGGQRLDYGPILAPGSASTTLLLQRTRNELEGRCNCRLCAAQQCRTPVAIHLVDLGDAAEAQDFQTLRYCVGHDEATSDTVACSLVRISNTPKSTLPVTPGCLSTARAAFTRWHVAA
jgi:hypothetical protein